MKWTEEEEQVLKKISEGGGTMEDVLKVFPYRSRESIKSRVGILRLSLAGSRPEIDMEAFKRFLKEKA